MKEFDNLVEKLRKELVALAMEKGDFSVEEVIRKSQELDEVLNAYYAFAHDERRDCTTCTHKIIGGKAVPQRKGARLNLVAADA